MIRVTYHDQLQAAPVVTFHGVEFKHGEPAEVPDDWSGLRAVRSHPHFSVDNGYVEEPKKQPRILSDQAGQGVHISIGQARTYGREAFASGHHRRAPHGFSPAQKKAWLEGFDRARRKARE